MQAIGGDPREEAKKAAISGILERAKNIALTREGLLASGPQHLQLAMFESLVEAILCNNEIVATLNAVCERIVELEAKLNSKVEYDA